MGDSRQTSYFYAFEGVQGDIFINVVTKNLTGDIDVFTADSLQPLTKMVLFADSSFNETGRLIYLRKPARLILRVEGRTPNDDPATFRIKFAGSFVALAAIETEDAPVVERSERNENSGIRVNSVGTIIEVLPQPVEEKRSIEAEEKSLPEDTKTGIGERSIKDRPSTRSKPAPEVKTVFGGRPPKTKEPSTEEAPTKTDANTSGARRDRRDSMPPSPKVRPPDPLASINLIILMKDGGSIERPMNEVVRFSVDKGVLTVVTKDGKTTRFSILNVERVTIQ